MSSKFYTSVVSGQQATPQSQPIPFRESEMVQNNAGGFGFAIDNWCYLDRFLILGSENNSYYASAQKLTAEAAKNVLSLIKIDPVRVVNRIVEISDAGRAPKNDSAIFALALTAVYANDEGKAVAFTALSKVCRTGTHLFQFVETINTIGKWNAQTKRGIANWYLKKPIDRMTYQMVKYQQRNGWSHRDVLRLAHVKPDSDERSAVFAWASDAKSLSEKQKHLPNIIHAYKELMSNPTLKNAIDCIDNHDMSWEMMPTSMLKMPELWSALIPSMGFTALIRNLGRMGSIDVLKSLSHDANTVAERLVDADVIARSRVHPITVLSALKTYSQGRGDKGSLQWSVNKRIVEALNEAFYLAFKNVEPTGKNFLIGVDCSSSMFGATVCGLNNLTAAEAAAVMAMAIVKTEKNYWIGGFNTRMGELDINPSMSLDQVMNKIRRFSWGGTDCALPMLHAIQHKMDVDCFVTITDNETWAGKIHPTQALSSYRKEMNKPNAKNIVCGTSTTRFSVADPKDPRQMDIVGFDSAVPQIISNFVRD